MAQPQDCVDFLAADRLISTFLAVLIETEPLNWSATSELSSSHQAQWQHHVLNRPRLYKLIMQHCSSLCTGLLSYRYGRNENSWPYICIYNIDKYLEFKKNLLFLLVTNNSDILALAFSFFFHPTGIFFCSRYHWPLPKNTPSSDWWKRQRFKKPVHVKICCRTYLNETLEKITWYWSLLQFLNFKVFPLSAN